MWGRGAFNSVSWDLSSRAFSGVRGVYFVSSALYSSSVSCLLSMQWDFCLRLKHAMQSEQPVQSSHIVQSLQVRQFLMCLHE